MSASSTGGGEVDVVADAVLSGVITSLVFTEGVQLLVVTYGFVAFVKGHKGLRHGQLSYQAMSFLLFGLFTSGTLLDAAIYFKRDPLLPSRGKEESRYGFATVCLRILTSLVGEGILLCRCFIMWRDKRWMVWPPSFIYLLTWSAYLVLFAIFFLVPGQGLRVVAGSSNTSFKSMWLVCSLLVSLMVNTLISFKLVQARRRSLATPGLPDQQIREQFGSPSPVAILVESAVPLTLCGTCYAAMLAVTSAGEPPQTLQSKLIVNYVFSALYFSFAVRAATILADSVTD
ncbi:hypothetical protein D9611_006573 [Ephemerocybe angulata]|uniref:Uncharacterized protein n=1 Tax=Ephemerocybe angulata TaxID=980116 RepID=A0A8H5C998_9AGAR|nr:hypothetical protein D9611_006573 [Tulosesus angulatus]